MVAPTLVWTAGEHGGSCRCVLYGARDERLRRALEECFGPDFHRTGSTWKQAETWSVDGRRLEVAARLQALGTKFEIVDDPGERLLAALPPLEKAIAEFREGSYPSAIVELQRLSDPSCMNPSRTWANLARGENVSDGVLRWNKPGRSPWLILRGGIVRELRTHEERAIAWWAELAREEGTRLIYDASSARLTLPASRLPPPVLVERSLIWADGHPPDFDPSDLSRSYRAITRARAQSAASVLGMMLEEVR